MKINRQNITKYLDRLDFEALFIEELGWDYPQDESEKSLTFEEQSFTLIPIADKRGFNVFLCLLENNSIPLSPTLKKIDQEISKYSFEHLIIYASETEKKQKWQWTKKENNTLKQRIIEYSKTKQRVLLDALETISFSLEEEDTLNILAVKERAKKAFDIEKVTKKFFTEFQLEHRKFVEFINGIEDIKDKNWYASVILNRLMFVYFLQKKGFLDHGNKDYLQDKLTQSKTKGENLYYSEFLQNLFFEGFGKREDQRTTETKQLIGKIKYLNGGLFLPHIIEQKYQGKITIKDQAFTDILQLFSTYTWHLDDTPTGNENEINPDVLGYIFEKYINQKAFGAYYTKPEITNYLCEKTINKYISHSLSQHSTVEQASCLLNFSDRLEICFTDDICNLLLDEILPNLSILDPACGSGAFLVAALQHLITVYTAIFDYIQTSGNDQNQARLINIKKSHPSLEYYIKKRIISDNLYGVDIMEEATEIAKLRLFLSLVASADKEEDLEPLPNVDFNIMAGNSLIGLIKVDGNAFDTVKQNDPPQPPLTKDSDPPQPPLTKGGSRGDQAIQGNFLNLLAASEYQKILAEKNESIKKYKEHSFKNQEIEGTDQDSRLQMLRDHIAKVNRESINKLNQLLLDEFTQKLGIKYEEVQLKGKSKKRPLTMQDIENLKPFHWGYHFDKIIKNGGFDIILGNPPWEVFQTDEKEFFQQFDNLIQKKKLDIKTWTKQFNEFMKDEEMQKAWLEYCSGYPHVSAYFKNAEQYKNQRSLVNGKSVARKINLYALFLEQCVNLLAKNGECGIVIPSGIYTDLGTKQLREMLFSQTTITGLFCFENRKNIFEGVDSRFKFVILTFENSPSPPQPPLTKGGEEVPLTKGDLGGSNQSFPAKFMRHEVSELRSFPDESAIIIDVNLIKKLSPDSLSIMEFKSDLDIEIAKKMARFPLLGEEIKDKWNLKLTQELNMTSDSYLFKTEAAKGRLPLYEGKMIHQFIHNFAEPRYWIDEAEGRKAVLGKKGIDEGQILDYQCYRLGFRKIGRNTDSRTLIATIIPPNFCSENFQTVVKYNNKYALNYSEEMYLVAVWNSFVIDFGLRQKISANVNMFYIYQLPIPRLTEGDLYFQDLVERAGKLICTSPEYDDLAQEIGLETHKNGVTNQEEREKIRAEIDGIVAHLYGLNEVEFKHILSTFPIVEERIKEKTLNAFLALKTN